ncbi:hypothetical protein Trydic_g17095 [Trypoxylus dichotomus]
MWVAGLVEMKMPKGLLLLELDIEQDGVTSHRAAETIDVFGVLHLIYEPGPAVAKAASCAHTSDYYGDSSKKERGRRGYVAANRQAQAAAIVFTGTVSNVLRINKHRLL